VVGDAEESEAGVPGRGYDFVRLAAPVREGRVHMNDSRHARVAVGRTRTRERQRAKGGDAYQGQHARHSQRGEGDSNDSALGLLLRAFPAAPP
jgi:hypothetical protein